MNLPELKLERAKYVTERDELNADIAAIDRLIARHEGSKAAMVVRDRTLPASINPPLPLGDESSGRINTAKLIRETLDVLNGDKFTLKQLCAKARSIQPLANVEEPTVAPQVSKMVKDGKLVIVSPRRGQVAAIYRNANELEKM